MGSAQAYGPGHLAPGVREREGVHGKLRSTNLNDPWSPSLIALCYFPRHGRYTHLSGDASDSFAPTATGLKLFILSSSLPPTTHCKSCGRSVTRKCPLKCIGCTCMYSIVQDMRSVRMVAPSITKP